MNLTPREVQVLDLILVGKVHKEVAVALNISVSLAKRYASSLYDKHGVCGRDELIRLKNYGGSRLEWEKLEPIDKRISRLSVEYERKEIARTLGLSKTTIGVRLRMIYAILRVRGRGGLLVYMAHHGVLYEESASIH